MQVAYVREVEEPPYLLEIHYEIIPDEQGGNTFEQWKAWIAQALSNFWKSHKEIHAVQRARYAHDTQAPLFAQSQVRGIT